MPSGPKFEPTSATDQDTDQVIAHPIAQSDEALGGAAVRLTQEFLLRSVNLISQISDGDLLEGLVMITIVSANNSHLDRDPATPGRFRGVEDVVPDEMRRPVSVLAIANTLNLPYETTRRYVGKHLAAGRCVRVKGGVIAIGESLRRDDYHEAIRVNMANLRRFHAALKRAGIKLD